MKRRIFFLLERLEINRSERIAISTLLIIMVLSSALSFLIETNANFSVEDYAELERIFQEKSRQIEQEKEIILARYEPTQKIPVTNSVREKNLEEVLPDTANESEISAVSKELININTASNEQLRKLPGVGPTYAKRIIDWRTGNGPFTSKNQLIEIKGIGEKRLARIKPLITL